MPLRLPPLSSLRFFEAAGRHQSFKRAAAELNVTASAISHGIVALEQFLGVALFHREPRKLSLTPAGADYLAYVAEAMSLIAIGTQRLPHGRGRRVIAVSCAPTFASRWLLPRLPDFRTRWPDVGLTVDTSRRQVGFPGDGFDFAVRMSRTPVAGSAWNRLFGEQLVPVCSPAYRACLHDDTGNIDFARATLLHSAAASEDWRDWLDQKRIAGIDVQGGLRFDMIQLAFEAAASGLGVAMGRRPLVDQDLASGRLIALDAEPMRAETAYWLVSSAAVEHRVDLLCFKRWVLQQAAQATAGS